MSNWDLVSFVSRSKNRRKILGKLDSNPMTPTDLGRSLSIQRSSISRALKELEDKGLVKALTKAKKGRFYGMTEKGQEILEKLDELKG